MFTPSYKEQLVKDLKPYYRNARTHSSAQVEKLAKSIQTFGFTNPIIVDENGGVIAGHGRLMAAKKLKLGTVPTIVIAGLDAFHKRALVLADNKLALDAGWDLEILRTELLELNDAPDFDFGLTGFTLDEATSMFLDLDAITGGEGEGDGEGGQSEPTEHDELLAKCRDLLKKDKAFAAIVNDRHAKLAQARPGPCGPSK